MWKEKKRASWKLKESKGSLKSTYLLAPVLDIVEVCTNVYEEGERII